LPILGGFTGRLEFYNGYRWGTVCDNLWSGSINAGYICDSMNLRFG